MSCLRPLPLLLSCLLALAVLAPASDASAARYLKYNVHAQDNGRDIKASYSGWVDPGEGHIVIPAGTKLKDTGEGHRFRSGFSFTTEDGREVFFEYHKGRMQMTEAEYLDEITSDSPVKLSSFSRLDQKGIKEGTVYEGMTRKGVVTALGYPARHKTPSLDADRYVYWRNRFRTMVVHFEDGKVSRIQY